MIGEDNTEKKSQTRVINIWRSAFFIIFLLIFLPLFGITCSAQINAEDYGPILYFEGEETYYPVEAEYHINNSNLETIDIQGTIINYYNNYHGSIKDNGVINNYKSQTIYEVKVYYRTYFS